MLTDATSQAAKQCMSTRHAVKQARIDEKAEVAKEEKRLEKERLAKEKAEEKAQKKAREKEAREKKREEAKERKKQEKEQQKAADSNSRRRGKGSDELHEGEDPACLTNRFPDMEVPILDKLEHFVQAMCQGQPVIWRARRPPLRKVLEANGQTDMKVLNQANTLLAAENKTFISEFAEQVEQSGGKTSKTIRGLSTEAQAYRDAFALDDSVRALLESWSEL